MKSDGNTGRLAENLAIAHLVRRGYRLLTRNYHCRRGEIDAVMLDHSTLVFIEVRCRAAGQNAALESITWTKRRRLLFAAQHYLAYHPTDLPCRFDVVVISGDPTTKDARIEHFPSAFSYGE
ncbi:MAG: YraN family protein [Limnochordia bacterium]